MDFKKNDEGFVCKNCGQNVPPLKYSSRDPCTKCLCSLHVDNMPGDRANECGGLLVPVEIETNSQKGFIIVYRCASCGKMHRNKSAQDDDINTIYMVANRTYNKDKL